MTPVSPPIHVRVVQPNGSDGYSPGTWRYEINQEGWLDDDSVAHDGWATFDGGYACREHAAECAQERLAKILAEYPQGTQPRVIVHSSAETS